MPGRSSFCSLDRPDFFHSRGILVKTTVKHNRLAVYEYTLIGRPIGRFDANRILDFAPNVAGLSSVRVHPLSGKRDPPSTSSRLEKRAAIKFPRAVKRRKKQGSAPRQVAAATDFG